MRWFNDLDWGKLLLMIGILFIVVYTVGWAASDTVAQRDFIDQCIVEQYHLTENRHAQAKDYCEAVWRLQ